jgi:hypothetical protein
VEFSLRVPVMEAALQNNENMGEQRALGVGSREFTSSAYQGEGAGLARRAKKMVRLLDCY